MTVKNIVTLTQKKVNIHYQQYRFFNVSMSTLKDAFINITLALCDRPEIAQVEWIIIEDEIHLRVTPCADDAKKIIGKHGVVANSIRTILHATHAKNKIKTYLSIRS